MEEETPDAIVNKFRHDINCLSDKDRAIRKGGLEKINKELFKIKKKENLEMLLTQYLMNPLIKMLEDQIEKHRETTINLLTKIVKEVDLERKLIIPNLLNEVLSRIDHTPFPEQSEELRIKLVALLDVLTTKYIDEFKPIVSNLGKMIAVLLKDPFPDLKIKLSEFISKLCREEFLKKEIGPHSKGMIISLCLNLKHQHNKIRKITIKTIVDVLLCDSAGSLFDECIVFLKPLANDKNSDVRMNFYTSMARLLSNFNIIYLRKFEPTILMLLLGGLSDEKDDVKAKTAQLIEECGENRKKLAIELKEDISQFE